MYSVLIVDDQNLPRQLFEHIIEGAENYTVAASIDSASVANLYCAKQHIDLILMDVVMADGVNGIEAAARIKQSYPAIKILVVTSMPDSTFLEKARQANVDSFWYKEVQEAPLLDVMDRTMAGEKVYPLQAPALKLGMAEIAAFTDREIAVLRGLVSGWTDKEISKNLGVSYHTVRFHINNLLSKSGCTTRTELAVCAAKQGIVVPDI